MTSEELQLQIKQNKECLEKLTARYGEDHDETVKQRQQIDELYKKLGNGWSGKVAKVIETTQERVTAIEKHNILVDSKLEVIASNVEELKNRPRNKMLWVKDSVYLALAVVSIAGFILTNVR